MRESVSIVHGFSFSGLVEVVRAEHPCEVIPALERVQHATDAGLHAAGFVCYEAAAGLDPALPAREGGGLPLLWFGIYRTRSESALPDCRESYRTRDWRPSLSPERYAGAVQEIRKRIAAGESYQVNFTLRQRFSFSGSPLAFFRDVSRSQPTPYASYLEADAFRIVSASPELFFTVKEGKVSCRPMKGTAPRGRWPEEDRESREALLKSPKERAENLMIVDLLRNDLGKISRTGSVTVPSLFDVESWPTVHQMTSTVEGELAEGVGVVEIFRALFPCGSVTGAPKRRSMEIIAELEDSCRSLYTGCIGYLSPGMEGCFSVAIRTAVIDTATGRGELGIGSGVTFDSAAGSEHAECLGKARFAEEPLPEFSLIESLLYDGEYYLLERHLARLSRSAAFFSFPFDEEAVRRALFEEAASLQGTHKVRLLLDRTGAVTCSSAPVAPNGSRATATFASVPVDSSNMLLYHKTTWRPHFTEELARHPERDEVIFVNERGEVTEGAISNVVALIDGELLTPPRECGLLPGVMREELLAEGRIRERVLTRRDLEEAEEIFLVNSVRKWRRAELVT